jgi:diguanylate cyclase (GGDEF)-like protein/PAS domain S-box-containing protein
LVKAVVPFGLLVAAAFACRPFLAGDDRFAAWSLGIGLLAAGAVLVGARRRRLPDRHAWSSIAAGAFLVPMGDTVALATRDAAGWGCRAVGVAAILFGLVRVARGRSCGRDAATLLDTGIVVAGVVAATWFVIGPGFIGASVTGRAAAATIVVAGLALLGVAAYLVLEAGLRSVAAAAVGVSGAAFFVAALMEAHGVLGAELASWEASVPAAVGALALGLAALHPSVERLVSPTAARDSKLRGARIVVIGLGSALTAATMVAYAFVARDGAVAAAVLAGLVLLGLVVARTALIIGGYERFVDREHVLREFSAALVAAESREDVATAVRDAALILAGGPRQALVEVSLGPRPDLTRIVNAVVVGEGPAVEAMRGELRVQGELGRLGVARTIVAPIVVDDRLAGMLRVTRRRSLPVHLTESMQTLATQSVLALEGVDHAEARVAEESEARFRSLIQNSSDIIAIVGADLIVRYVTPSVRAMLGYEVSDVVGTELGTLLHPAEAVDVSAMFAGVAERGEVEVHEFRLRHRDGRWRTVEGAVGNMLTDLSVRGLVLTAHDVTERRALEDQLAHQAFHDALSGLPNRALFGNRVDHAIDRAARSGTDLAVLFVDLDDFKTVNDSLGHGTGDELLVAVAGRLGGCLRAADTAARLGGDEFAMLLEDINGVDGAVGVAGRLIDALAQPIVVGRTELFVRASIGIVVGKHGQTTEELLRNADVAMYRAKGRGGNCFEVFEPAMHQAALTRLELKADLARAFAAGALHVEYQPIVSLATAEITCIEALLRWRHAERGHISPVEFIPLAEETGLIVELGDWVLRQAASDLVAWQRQLPTDRTLGISVNISGRQLQSPGFVERVASALAESGVAASDVILEITESTLMDEVELVIARLAEVRNLGVRIAVDDFGTGFSSLGYLQRFPVDILKIAKPFVDELGGDDRPSRLVQAVIGLAGSLDLDTIAEGIETQEQREQLVSLGCALGQGYLFSRPLRADDIRPLLRSRMAA